MTAADEKQPIPTSEISKSQALSTPAVEDEKNRIVSERSSAEDQLTIQPGRTTLVSLAADGYRWLQENFPTVTAVVAHLPFALVLVACCLLLVDCCLLRVACC